LFPEAPVSFSAKIEKAHRLQSVGFQGISRKALFLFNAGWLVSAQSKHPQIHESINIRKSTESRWRHMHLEANQGSLIVR